MLAQVYEPGTEEYKTIREELKKRVMRGKSLTEMEGGTSQGPRAGEDELRRN